MASRFRLPTDHTVPDEFVDRLKTLTGHILFTLNRQAFLLCSRGTDEPGGILPFSMALPSADAQSDTLANVLQS